MRYLTIPCVIAAFALAGPLATQSRADDAHHPEKAAASKKVKKAKPKQQKKPAETTGKSQQQSELSIERGRA